MSRIRVEKDYQEKKRRIMLQSISLLDEIGFAAFSINKVIAKAGLTKGAFFHYFESKQALMDGMSDLFMKPMVEAFEQVASDNALDPKQKIRKMFTAASEAKGTDKRETQQLILLLNKSENQPIRQMIMTRVIKECVPIYEKVIIDGNEKGQFRIEHPNGAAYLYLSMIVAINKEIGAVMYRKEVDQRQLELLKSKVMAFEEYARGLFGFDEEINLYNEGILNVDLK